MTTGIYSQTLRNLIRHDDQRVILEFWANDIALNLGNHIVLDYLARPGSMTACHNVASTLVQKAGTGTLTTLRSDGADMSAAVNAVRNGGYVMEIKFHKDHSVCLFSTVADPDVEILEGWAGSGLRNRSVEPYMFIKSVYEHHDAGRIPKDDAADALQGAVSDQNLEENVGALTRCIATACGIEEMNFRVTVKYRALDNINAFQGTAKQEIKDYTARISAILYLEWLQTRRSGATVTLRCRKCFKKMPVARGPEIKWHHCRLHHEVYCDTCAIRLTPTRSREGAGRKCSRGDAMTRF